MDISWGGKSPAIIQPVTVLEMIIIIIKIIIIITITKKENEVIAKKIVAKTKKYLK